MTAEELAEARALLVRAATDPNWVAASEALEELMRRLLVVHRLLEAEERLAKRRSSGTKADRRSHAPADELGGVRTS